MPDPRRPLDTLAVAAMLLLSSLWGFQQVAIKLAAHAVPLLLQGALRSAIACTLLLVWAWVRGIALRERDGTLLPGLAAGLAFGAEFAFIYAGLAHTTAARMVVFVYLAPCLTALGLTLFVPGEALRPRQWCGIGLAFAGIAVAFTDGFAHTGRSTFTGDLCGIVAAVLWAATTVLIRGTRLAHAKASKVLLYQLAVSAAVLALASRLLGEGGVATWTATAIASLAYQSAIVAFASYLTWFWLLTRYLAARLSVFSFLAPLFGVFFGWVILDDPLSPAFLAAALLVGAGIALVNGRGPPPRGAARSQT
jgi:drug/metabolite transporter (DMT)-like permease